MTTKKLLLGLSLLLLSAALAWGQGQCDAEIYYEEAPGREINLSANTPPGKNIFCNTDQTVYKLLFKPKTANAIIQDPRFGGAPVRQGATPYSFSVRGLAGKPTKDGEEYLISLQYFDDKFTSKNCEAKIKVQTPLNLILTGLNQDRQYCQTDDQEVTIVIKKGPNDDIGNDDIPDGILEVVRNGKVDTIIPESGANYKYTYKFKPSDYPPGAHVLRFRSTTNNDYKCESVIQTNFEITPDPGNADIIVNGSPIGPNETRCIPANKLTTLTARLGGQALSVGVSFSGPSSGLVNRPNETTFDPRNAGPGPHNIVFTYQVGGCRVTRSFRLQPVADLPDFSLASSAYLCADANPINLNPNPAVAGATFAITPAPGPNALLGNTLFPGRIASPVNPNTRYQITYSGNLLPEGCSFEVAKDFFLRAPTKPGFPEFNFEKGLAFCTQDPPFAISVLPSGGNFQVIDPATNVAIPGAIQTDGIQGDEKINFAPLADLIPGSDPFKKFILRYQGPIPANPGQDPCPYNGEIEFYVSKPPVPKLTLTQNVFAVCSATSARKFDLSGNYDVLAQNITYSGPAVKKENGKWIFEPATAGDGLHIITYTVKVGSCQASAQDTVTVFNPPRVLIDERLKAEYCNSESPVQFRVLPGGGAWAPAHLAMAITPDPSDPTLFTLDPSKMPVGSQTLNYSATLDGCPFTQSVRINIKAGPQASIGGIAPVLCQSRGALQLNPQPAGGALRLEPPISGALVGNILQVNVLPPAKYELTYSGKDPLTGCGFSATATFRVGADPISASPQDIGLPAKICKEADIVALRRPTASGFPQNGVFSGPGIQSQNNNFTFDPLLAGPGVHVINYSGEIDGCPYTFAYRVEVPLTAIAVEPSAVTICRGQEAALKVMDVFNTGYSAYSWSPSPKTSLNTQNSEAVVSPGQTTVYTITAGNRNTPENCPAATTAIVRVVEPGTVNTRIQDVTRSGYWDGRVSATFDSLPAGRYRIVIENLDASGSCRRETTVTVNEPNCNNFNVSIAPGLAVCGGSGIVVQPQVTGGGGSYTYRWSPATGVSSTTSAAPTITPRQSTVYTLEVSDNALGCRKTLLVPINVLTPVDPNLIGLPPRLEVCAGSGVNLRAAGGSTYTWSPSEGLSATNTQSVVAAPAQTTTYFVEVSNGDARCSQKASVVVVVNPLPQASATVDRASCPTCPDGSVRIISSTATGYWLEGQNNNQYQSSPSFSGLRPGVYQYRVRDARGCESAIQTLTVTPLPPSDPTPPCDSPLAPMVTLQTQQNAVQLTWNAVANATGYVVSVCEENNPLVCPVERRAVSGTTLTLPSSVFAEGKRYVARVQTVCAAAQSAFSNGSSFALPGPPPPACPAPRINENSYVEMLSAEYRFFWEGVAGATGYELRICPESPPSNCTIVTAATNQVSVSSASFITGKRYVISVRSLCPNNISSVYSNSVTLSLPGRCPIPAVTSISYRGSLVDIRWEAINEILPSGSYEIQICQANNPNVCIPGSPRISATNALTLSGGSDLVRGVEYAIQVRSRCSNGLVSDYSEPFRFTYNNAPITVCPPPANAAVVSNANRGVTIEWSSVQGATQYRLEVWPVNNTNAATTYNVNAPTTTYTLTLAAGQVYNYRVYSICGARLSGPSRTREFTVAAARAASVSPSSLYAVYPNPNTGQFWILLEADRAEQGQLVISDLAGRAVYSGTLDIAPGPNEFFIDPGNLTPGVYMVTLTLAGRSETARVVVQ